MRLGGKINGWAVLFMGVFCALGQGSPVASLPLHDPPPPKNDQGGSQPGSGEAIIVIPIPGPFGVIGGGGGGGVLIPLPGGTLPGFLSDNTLAPLPGSVNPIYSFPNAEPESAKTRHPLFVTRSESVYRSPLVARKLIADTAPVTDLSLSLETFKRECENDALIAQREYESHVQVIEINRRLHAQVAALRKRNKITEQDFEESKTTLGKSEWRARELKQKWQEFLAEREIAKLKIAQKDGALVRPSELAKAYAHLWGVRVEKFRAAEGGARLGYKYCVLTHKKYKKMEALKAVSPRDVIKSERDMEEAGAVWNLARSLVEQNEGFHAEALDTVTAAEQFEKHAQQAANDAVES